MKKKDIITIIICSIIVLCSIGATIYISQQLNDSDSSSSNYKLCDTEKNTVCNTEYGYKCDPNLRECPSYIKTLKICKNNYKCKTSDDYDPSNPPEPVLNVSDKIKSYLGMMGITIDNMDNIKPIQNVDYQCTNEYCKYLYYCLQNEEDLNLYAGYFYYFLVALCSILPSCFGNNKTSPYGIQFIPKFCIEPIISNDNYDTSRKEIMLTSGLLGGTTLKSNNAIIRYGKTPPTSRYWSVTRYIGGVEKYWGKMTNPMGTPFQTLFASFGDTYNIYDFAKDLYKKQTTASKCPSSCNSPNPNRCSNNCYTTDTQLCSEPPAPSSACYPSNFPVCPWNQKYIIISTPNQSLMNKLVSIFESKVGSDTIIIQQPFYAGATWNTVKSKKTMENKYQGEDYVNEKNELKFQDTFPNPYVKYNEKLYDCNSDIISMLQRTAINEGDTDDLQINAMKLQPDNGLLGIEWNIDDNDDEYHELCVPKQGFIYQKPVLPLVYNDVLQGTERTPTLQSDFSQFVKTIVSQMSDRGYCQLQELNTAILCPPNSAWPTEIQDSGVYTSSPGARASSYPVNGPDSILLVSEFQGDCPDAVYWSSESVCLGENDVVICMGINHANVGTSIYNNYNVYSWSKTASCANSVTSKDATNSFFNLYTNENGDPKFMAAAFSKTDFTCPGSLIDAVNGTTSLINVDLPFPNSGSSATPEDTILFTERVYVNRAVPIDPTDLPSSSTDAKNENGDYKLIDMLSKDMKNKYMKNLNQCCPDPSCLIKFRVLVFSPTKKITQKYCSYVDNTNNSATCFANNDMNKKCEEQDLYKQQDEAEDNTTNFLTETLCGATRLDLNVLKQTNLVERYMFVILIISLSIIFSILLSYNIKNFTDSISLMTILSTIAISILLIIVMLGMVEHQNKQLDTMTASEAQDIVE